MEHISISFTDCSFFKIFEQLVFGVYLNQLFAQSFGSIFVPRGSHKSSIFFEDFFMPNIYIIYSGRLDKYYVGAGIDLQRRLHEHHIGYSKFTFLGLPWILKHLEHDETLALAKKRELKIKKKKSGIYIEKLIGSSNGWASRFSIGRTLISSPSQFIKKRSYKLSRNVFILCYSSNFLQSKIYPSDH